MITKSSRPMQVAVAIDKAMDETKDPADGVAMTDSPDAQRTSNWVRLVTRIQQNDRAAMEELYNVFSKGIRFFLCRQLGPQELDDKVHDTFLIVVQAIQRGELREPERLMGFVRTIVRRQVAGYIDEIVQNRRESTPLEMDAVVPDERRNPEQSVAFQQKIQLMKDILRSLGDRDREILTRFYISEQSQEQICEDMELTDTQFRLFKSRAKARFSILGKRRLQRSNLLNLFVRASVRRGH